MISIPAGTPLLPISTFGRNHHQMLPTLSQRLPSCVQAPKHSYTHRKRSSAIRFGLCGNSVVSYSTAGVSEIFLLIRTLLRLRLFQIPTSIRRYQPDEKNSGMAEQIAPHGWQVSNFKISSQSGSYRSNFGHPNATTPYQYNEVVASFLLIRDPWRHTLRS
jgi:hypothetical protein